MNDKEVVLGGLVRSRMGVRAESWQAGRKKRTMQWLSLLYVVGSIFGAE